MNKLEEELVPVPPDPLIVFHRTVSPGGKDHETGKRLPAIPHPYRGAKIVFLGRFSLELDREDGESEEAFLKRVRASTKLQRVVAPGEDIDLRENGS